MKTLLLLAALVLSNIFSDHAVMQRETTALRPRLPYGAGVNPARPFQ